MNKAFVVSVKNAHFQWFKKTNSVQQKSCTIFFLNFVNWIEMISQYDFSSINASTLHYLFALSY